MRSKSIDLSAVVVSVLKLSLLSNSSPNQTSVLGLGVDFVLPLSQQQEQEQEQEQQEPHQNIPEGKVQNVLNFAKSHAKANQTHATPLPTLILSPLAIF